ncbi:MAG: type IV toxin-antitoxin system AbiEi family antitoxin domain-containing protein, partial [Rhodococcus sp.]|nr:type IV toxin-antitoxin system AbiEi family antitoxin domain-containing protein [Rhodococcus sp. (in: high G+C Gram-positive bacteria)]
MYRGTGGIIRRCDALARGYSDKELHRARRCGDLVSLGPGAYAAADDFAALDTYGQHRLRVKAAVHRSNNAVVSHVSAAVMHGFDVWNLPLAHVHMTVNRASGGAARDRTFFHATPFSPAEVAEIDGVPVTTAARTLVDLGRTASFEEAVVVGDHALRLGATTPDDLRAALTLCSGRKGVPAARRVIEFVDGGSGSVGESRSRVTILELGLPQPQLQKDIYDAYGRFVARVDFYWPEFGVVGEFDGFGKYSMTPGKSERDMLRAEKAREDALRELGLIVVRWTWADL